MSLQLDDSLWALAFVLFSAAGDRRTGNGLFAPVHFLLNAHSKCSRCSLLGHGRRSPFALVGPGRFHSFKASRISSHNDVFANQKLTGHRLNFNDRGHSMTKILFSFKFLFFFKFQPLCNFKWKISVKLIQLNLIKNSVTFFRKSILFKYYVLNFQTIRQIFSPFFCGATRPFKLFVCNQPLCLFSSHHNEG